MEIHGSWVMAAIFFPQLDWSKVCWQKYISSQCLDEPSLGFPLSTQLCLANPIQNAHSRRFFHRIHSKKNSIIPPPMCTHVSLPRKS